MFAEYAGQAEFRHSVELRAREQRVLELIADHRTPPPPTCPERLLAHAARLRASARRTWPRPIGATSLMHPERAARPLLA